VIITELWFGNRFKISLWDGRHVDRVKCDWPKCSKGSPVCSALSSLSHIASVDEGGRTGLYWNGLNYIGLDWILVDCTVLDYIGLYWSLLDCTGVYWTGLDYIGLGWIILDWT